MKKAILLSIAAVAALIVIARALSGGGPGTSAIEQFRAEQKRGFAMMRREMRALNAQARQLRGRFSALDADLMRIRDRFAYDLVDESGTDEPSAAVGSGPGEDPGGETAVELVEADVRLLAPGIATLKADMKKLQLEIQGKWENDELADPRKTWSAMGDPVKVAYRIDRFALKWSPTFEDETTRQAFLDDVEAFKKKVVDRTEMPKHQLIEAYRTMLTARMGQEQDEHLRQWYEQQMMPLDSKREKMADGQLKLFMRYDTAHDLEQLTKKYKIPKTKLRAFGLQTSGAPVDWTPVNP